MRTKMIVSFALLMVAGLILTSCAAPTPQVVRETVVVAGTPQVVERTVVVPGATQVVQQTVVVPGTPVVRPKLRMWVDHNFYVKASEAVLKAYALQWAQQNGVDLEFTQDSDAVMYPRIDAAIESKTLPDVLYTNISYLPKLQRANALVDATDLVKELNGNMGGFTKGPLAAVSTVDGKYAGVPIAASAEEAYFRQDLLDAKGLKVPDTWEQLLQVAKAINNPPTVWGWGQQVAPFDGDRHNSAMIISYGGSIFAKDGKTIALDSPATRQAINLVKSAYDQGMIPKDVVTWDDAGNNNCYQTAKCGIIENTGSVATWLLANDPTLFKNTTFAMFPQGPQGRFIQGDVWVLFVPNTSKYPDQAKSLIRYLSSTPVQTDIITAMAGFRIPVYADLTKLPMWQDRQLKPLADAAPYLYMVGYPGPVTSLALEVFNQKVVAKMMVRVLSDGWTADQAIKEAVDKITAIQSQIK